MDKSWEFFENIFYRDDSSTVVAGWQTVLITDVKKWVREVRTILVLV